MGHRETFHPKPAYTWPLKNLFSHFPAPVSLSTCRAMWSSHYPDTWLVCPSNQLCSSCLAAALVPLHTSLTAGFEEWPPTTGKCLSHSSPSRVNSCLCPRQVAMFSPQWKLCFHMSLPPMAGTSAWASVPLCMPVPL